MSFKEYLKGRQAPPTQIRRILPFIFVVVAVFGLLHFLVYYVITRSIHHPSLNMAIALILALGLISMPVGFLATKTQTGSFKFLTWCGYIWMGVFNFLFFFSLLEIPLSFLIAHHYSYWVTIAAALISMWALFRGLSSPQVIRYYLHKTELAGLKLVHISDLHVGMLHLNKKWLERVVNTINSLKPDILALTGDLVEGSYNDVAPQLEAFSNLLPDLRKFYTTGNHEYIHHSEHWEKQLDKLGFITLHNNHRIIPYNHHKLLIAGVPDRMVNRFFRNQHSLPDVALKTAETAVYRLLMAHEPATALDIKTESCDLLISGHTHGGQIFPFHFLVALVQPVVSGFKKINNVLVFAHQGTGFWGPPMRWFSRSEIVVFEWR